MVFVGEDLKTMAELIALTENTCFSECRMEFYG